MKEFDFIQWIKNQNSFGPKVLTGIGDDAAVVDIRGQNILAVTTDTLVEGVDFEVRPDTLFGIGWKALCVSISDIAAMGLKPSFGVCTIAIPKTLNKSDLELLYRGMKTASDNFQTPVIGGDLSSTPGAMTLTSTVFATDNGFAPIERSGAKPGDVLCVTGELGGSLLGKHLSFAPRVEEAVFLNSHFHSKAMLDISDGLSGDLGHLCKASNCGAEIDDNLIPVSSAAKIRAAQSGKSPLWHALHDGEDFELLFALAERDWKKLREIWNLETPVHNIGVCVKEGLWIRESGLVKPLTVESWEHGFGSGL